MSTAFGTGVIGPDGRLLDQVRLSGVSARGYHGVLASERQTGQEFRADVVLFMDTRPAAAGDDLAQTVSYADVAQDVHDILTGEPADLVETVAERIAAAALARPLVQAVDVRVHKPHAPIPVPFADVEVAIRRDRTTVPVVAAPAALAGLAAQDFSEPELAAPLASYALDPEPQDFQPVARQVTDEQERFQQESFAQEAHTPYESEARAPYEPEAAESALLGAEPVAAQLPAEQLPVRTPVDEPEPIPVPELIAPAPLQVVPAAWDLPPESPAQPEPLGQSEQLDRGPVFQPEQGQQEPVFEPVQQYESVQGLDQWTDTDQRNGFADQQYGQFAQPQPEPQQFDQPQQSFEQQSFEQPPRVGEQQLDPQQNQYDQLFEQQYDQGDMETTRVTGAVPDSAVGQPEQYAHEQYSQEQYAQDQYPHEQFVQEPYVQGQPSQQEPRDRFDEVPAGNVDVVIAIGANLGDPQATMRSAVAELDRMPGLQITDVSPLARTAAVGGPEEQPDYLNAVLLARTTLPARGLLHLCLEVESLHGRTREEHWGPRTLDVDLIAYGTLADAAEDLELPHPRAHERAFVLEPWSQIAPEAVLPGLGGGPVAQLAATAPDRAGIRWLALDWLSDPEPEQGAGPAAAAEPVAVDGGVAPEQEAHATEMPPVLPPSVPPSGRPPVSHGGPVVEVPGGGHPQDGAGYQEQHPQAYSSGPVQGLGGSGPVPQQESQQAPVAQQAPPHVGMNGSAVPPPEEALVPAPPIAPRAVRDTAHEVPEHEALPAPGPAKPVFAPVNPSRQQAGVFPPVGGSSNGAHDPAVGGVPNGQLNGYGNGQQDAYPNGQQDAYDNDHTVIRVPGYANEQAAAPADSPIDSVPAWGPVRDERGRDV